MATPDKDTLTAEVSELHAQLKTQFEKSKEETLSQGRSFNPLGWWAGAPESQKYPPGPAFVPLGRPESITNWTGLWNMDKGEWFRTALGAGALYAVGATSATSVGVKSAHRLGFWCAVPAALVGLVAGQRNGVYRYLGYTDNGNPAIYPGYVENSAPYFMRHEVSERHAPVAASSKLQ